MPVTKVLTAGIGEADLRNIDVYRQRGGYKQWERAVRELKPADVLDLSREVGLAGSRRRSISHRSKMVVFAEGQISALSGL